MRVKVLFFGLLRDLTGRREDEVEVPAGSTPADVFARYTAHHAELRKRAGSVAVARNHQFSNWNVALEDGDEIAFMPPVSGGSGPPQEIFDRDTGNFFALTRVRIDVGAISKRLQRPEDGAVVDFLGVVRNNTKGRATRYLDYECYEPMALNVMADLGREIAASHAIGRIAMVHRLGRLEIGEASVAIVVSAPHRRPAFDAALEGIDRLKKIVPVWKKEYFEDGEVWVEGEWDDSVVRRS